MNWLGLAAALSGAVAIAAGAFGAHGVAGQPAEWLRTGGSYQLLHAVAALVALQMGERGVGWTMLAGATIFAGTLYLMAMGCPRWLGAITPIGGGAMIGGWLWFAWALAKW
jgi:uncharacterized membrane protein YgdD (TMEM256/DUF423 family)